MINANYHTKLVVILCMVLWVFVEDIYPSWRGLCATTYMGRVNIEIVAKTIVEKYRGELVYGDTDTLVGSTPVLILQNNKICYTTLENLSVGDWQKTVTGKEISSPRKDIKVWSDQGFTEIKYVMRHAIEKPLIKVTTHTGNVVCTLDHSLLWETGQPALGSEIRVNDKLCHRKLPLPDDTPKEPVYPNNLTVEKIRAYVISDEVYQGLSAKLAFVWGTSLMVLVVFITKETTIILVGLLTKKIIFY